MALNRTRRALSGLSRLLRAPARLAQSSGRAPERALFENLEERKLLFALTIDPASVDPFTGLGSAVATVGYAIPLLQNLVDLDDPEDPEVYTLDFNAIEDVNFIVNSQRLGDDGFAIFLGGPSGSGLVSPTPGSSVQLVPQGTDIETERLRVRLDESGEAITLGVSFDEDDAPLNLGRLRPVQRAEFELQAFDPDNVRLEVLLGGEVVATFSGAAEFAGLLVAGSVNNGTFAVTEGDVGQLFDAVRLVGDPGQLSDFFVDNVFFTQADLRLAQVTGARVFGFQVIFTGPAGASANFFDLYGRSMVNLFEVGEIEGSDGVVILDRDADGVPDFNDGLGRIVLSGVNAQSVLRISGGTIESADMDDDDPRTLFRNGFLYTPVDSFDGFFDDFEAAGFGFAFDPGTGDDPAVWGLPPGPGSVVIGSPYVRAEQPGNNDYDPVVGDYNPLGQAAFDPFASLSYNRAEQGFFVLDGSTMGAISVHGMLFGSSSFAQSLGTLAITQLYGSVGVGADLGQLIVAGDAGVWTIDPDAPTIRTGGSADENSFATGSTLSVGRTAREALVGGKSRLNINVAGNVTNPDLEGLDQYNYTEREFITSVSPDAENGETAVFDRVYRTPGSSGEGEFDAFFANPAYMFGESLFRNDVLTSAEWIGGLTSSVRIFGSIGGFDPISSQDAADVYAFASDGSTPLAFDTSGNILITIRDADGRVLASPNVLADGERDFGFASGVLEFTPNAPGVYYLAVTSTAGADTGSASIPYSVRVLGTRQTTLGAYRVAGSSYGNTVNVQSGDMGAARIGTGRFAYGGGDTDPTGVINPDNDEGDAESVMRLLSGAYSVDGTLYGMLVGADIESGNRGGSTSVVVGRDFGALEVGFSPVAGIAPNEGDVGNFLLQAARNIGVLDVRGSVGWALEDTSLPPSDIGFVTVIAGADGVGDIGLFRVGGIVDGTSLSVSVPRDGIFGGLLVQQDLEPLGEGLATFNGITGQANIAVGPGGDVRFVDTPQVDGNNTNNLTIPLLANTPLEIIDDGGSRVILQVLGSTRTGVIGQVRLVPINGSLGVAIAQILIDLSGGERLDIIGDGVSGDVASIGRIIVTGSSGGSAIRISGNAEVDVWRIEQQVTDPFQQIENFTPNGDLVAVDMAQLQILRMGTGDLGRTQTPEWGPRLIGPFLGVTGAGVVAEVGGALGYNAAVNNDEFNGGTFRPVNDAPDGDDGNFLSDQGSLFDGWLNGLVVRSGSVDTVTGAGALGDIILQGEGQGIVDVIANNDGITPVGDFEGIIGTIYADIINNVDIGDGLVGPGSVPFAQAGIFAADDIVQVVGGRIPGAEIRGVIGAFNRVNDLVTLVTSIDGVQTRATVINNPVGIGTIQLVGGGDFVDATILASTLTSFYSAVFASNGGANTGRVTILGTDADFFRSIVDASQITNVELTNGAWDGSQARTSNAILAIRAREFRNSTLIGLPSERRTSSITAGEDIGTIETFGQAGDIADLTIDTNAGLTGRLAGRNFTRVSFDADTQTAEVNAAGEVRGSQFTTGRMNRFFSTGDVRTTTISVAGIAQLIRSNGSFLNTAINITGPDARLVELSAGNSFAGSVTSAGPVDTFRTESGDLIARVETTRGRATVGTIESGRDLRIDAIFLASVNRLAAGRHIGTPGTSDVILVRGTLGTVALPNGQLYSDIRANRSIGSVTIGQGVSVPGRSNLGSGSIESFSRIGSVTINGDFDANIISYAGGIGTVRINNGSFLPDNLIAAYDGDIAEVIIDSGHLLGDIHADYSIFAVRVIASADGVFGDIGINPALSAGTPYNAFRNQLPATALVSSGFDGPRITAGINIGTVQTTAGGVFEAFIYAGRALSVVDINGGVANDAATTARGTVFAAGSRLGAFTIAGNASNAFFLAGIYDFGANGRPGGTGPNADTTQPGVIESVSIAGSASNLIAAAGVTPGSDGIYATLDDRIEVGVSSIQGFTVAGVVSGVTLISDSLGVQPASDARFVRLGTMTPLTDSRIFNGIGIPGATIPAGAAGLAYTHNGTSGRIFFSGPGQAYWDAAGGRVVLVNTTLASTLRVTTNTNVLTDFDVVTNDDASIGTLTLEANLLGTSSIIIDAFANSITLGNFAGTGNIRLGANVATLTMGDFRSGTFDANFVQNLTINGSYGVENPDVTGEASIDLVAAGTITITGTARGKISVDRDAGTLNIARLETSLLRVGGNLGQFLTGPMSETRLSVENTLSRAVISGDMFDSAIMLGADLGRDADFGGSGVDADTISAGFTNGITVEGDFERSDIVAGYLRGPDGFFGTADDTAAAGRSFVGEVTIAGDRVGSNANSESYRIASTGFLGAVTIDGQQGTDRGNLRITDTDAAPLPIQVEDLSAENRGGRWVATLEFNQDIDAATIASALSIAEIRNGGLTQILLASGSDYTVEVDGSTATITFAREITQRDLADAQGGLAGPGVYRFTLDADLLRSTISTLRLDGNGDGFARAGDDYSQDTIIGDAGDRLTPETLSVSEFAGLITRQIDLFGPIDLDVVLDDNVNPDGLPDANRGFTLRGAIGDNPDNGVNTFRAAADLDVYTITLQAGQILRLSEVAGSATNIAVLVYNAAGELVSGSEAVDLAPTQRIDATGEILQDGQPASTSNLLIRQTGQYVIVVGNVPDEAFTSGAVSDVDAALGTVGDYAIDLEIFDDGNTGFAGDTDSGDGANVVEAPVSQAFAGLDGVLNTADDLARVVIGAFSFELDAGADGIKGTGDDVVSGGNGAGIVSTRAGGVVTTSISGAIGPGDAAGVPSTVYPDADVFHLNNRQPIQPGTRLRITVKLSELGADLGSGLNAGENIGDVQFALFDTTTATSVDDALLVFSPSEFSPNGSTPRTIANNGVTAYGFDARGDFFIDFRTPGRVDSGGTVAASYAIYLQGLFNSNYRIEVQNLGAADRATRQPQNVLIETRGGNVEWLRTFGLEQQLEGFSASAVGLAGAAPGGGSIDRFLIDSLVSRLNAVFNTAGLNVVFSANPNDFEFQDYSTVFLTNTSDPAAIFSSAAFDQFVSVFTPFRLGETFDQTFGVSQRSDPLNTDRNDEAVVYTPAFGALGFSLSADDLNEFADALTAAVGRRVGELMGLRITEPHGGDEAGVFDIMSSDSVIRRPSGGVYEISDMRRGLSTRTDSVQDTNFYLGQTIDLALLYRYTSRV